VAKSSNILYYVEPSNNENKAYLFIFQYRKSDFPRTGHKLWERPQNNANFCWHILRNVWELHRTFPILSVAGLKFGVWTCHKGQSYYDAMRAAPALLSTCKNISHIPV
jgi:hypothetical protein